MNGSLNSRLPSDYCWTESTGRRALRQRRGRPLGSIPTEPVPHYPRFPLLRLLLKDFCHAKATNSETTFMRHKIGSSGHPDPILSYPTSLAKTLLARSVGLIFEGRAQ